MSRAQTFGTETAAQMLGVAKGTLLDWERKGRIPPAKRDERGWRQYTIEDIEAIRREVYGPELPSLDISTAEVGTPNRFVGVVHSVESEGLLSEVVVEVEGDHRLVVHMPRKACLRLALRKGSKVTVWVRPEDLILSR
jgi:molybdopterin-binding protein